jgi:3-oxoacyl-[acyl-carrier protein] reductase
MTEAVAQHFGPDFDSTLEFSVTESMVSRFAELTGDQSSLHVDEQFALRSIYRKRIAHGMLPVSYVPFCPGLGIDGRRGRLVEINAHFSAPAYYGDRLKIAVELGKERRKGPEMSFDFRIERLATQEVLTAGSFVLTYDSEPTSRKPRGGDSKQNTLPLNPPEMRNLRADEIQKGDVDGFAFRITNAIVESFRALLVEGVANSQSARQAVAHANFECSSLLGVTLFSTLVGMRLPGESATFLDFAANVGEQLQTGCEYRLEARVAHVSRGTNIVKAEVRIVASNSQNSGSIVGKVVTLATQPARAHRAMKDLRDSATDLDLKGKVVLITGASRGIGETTARLFALFGANVVVNYRRGKENAERIVREILEAGGSAIAVQADVSVPDQASALVASAVEHFGGIDILVNNAVRDFRSIAYADLDWEEIQADLDVTVKGAFLCAKLVTPYMRKRGGGKIVNISSVYAADPPADQLKYVVSKSALEGLARGLAAELAGLNIQVNTVVPSFVDTDIASQLHDGIRKKKAQESPMKRNATPEDVAHAILFLASSFSSYTTGQRILVTGGGSPYL